MNRWITLGILLAIVAAAFLRWPASTQRPFHNDEAVNGIKFARLWEKRLYRYDPNEHHGPSLYYFSRFFGKLTAAPASASRISDERLRWVTVLFGLGLIPPLVLLRDGLGRFGVLWAAIFTAVSTSFVFYSVYYIHEMLLVFFSFLVLCFAWRYWRSRKVVWALLCGVSLGLMAATKETFVLSVAAAIIALLLNHGWNRLLDASDIPRRAQAMDPRHLAAAAAAALFTAVLFFTSFFTNAQGTIDAVRTYQPWLARAGGDSPHLHPWYFFAERLLFYRASGAPFWSEALILVLACVGAYAGFARKAIGDSRASLLRFMAFYSFCLAGIYSAILYKTPWCLLGFWHGFILLAGAGAAWLVRNCPRGWRQVAVLIVLLALTAQLGWQAYNSLNKYGADRRNPYVYAQTLPDLRRLTARVGELVRHEQGARTLIKVVAPESDYWPLPWYFIGYPRVGWWDALPSDPYAPIMIVSAKLDPRLDEKGTHLMVGYFELRPSVFLELYVELELWKRFLAQH